MILVHQLSKPQSTKKYFYLSVKFFFNRVKNVFNALTVENIILNYPHTVILYKINYESIVTNEILWKAELKYTSHRMRDYCPESQKKTCLTRTANYALI